MAEPKVSVAEEMNDLLRTLKEQEGAPQNVGQKRRIKDPRSKSLVMEYMRNHPDDTDITNICTMFPHGSDGKPQDRKSVKEWLRVIEDERRGGSLHLGKKRKGRTKKIFGILKDRLITHFEEQLTLLGSQSLVDCLNEAVVLGEVERDKNIFASFSNVQKLIYVQDYVRGDKELLKIVSAEGMSSDNHDELPNAYIDDILQKDPYALKHAHKPVEGHFVDYLEDNNLVDNSAFQMHGSIKATRLYWAELKEKGDGSYERYMEKIFPRRFNKRELNLGPRLRDMVCSSDLIDREEWAMDLELEVRYNGYRVLSEEDTAHLLDHDLLEETLKKMTTIWDNALIETDGGYKGVRQCLFNKLTHLSGRRQHELFGEDLNAIQLLLSPLFYSFMKKRIAQRMTDIKSRKLTPSQCFHTDLNFARFTTYDPDKPFICVYAYQEQYSIDLVDPVTCTSIQVDVPHRSIIIMDWNTYHRGKNNLTSKMEFTHRLHIKAACALKQTLTDEVNFLNCTARRCMGMSEETEVAKREFLENHPDTDEHQ